MLKRGGAECERVGRDRERCERNGWVGAESRKVERSKEGCESPGQSR